MELSEYQNQYDTLQVIIKETNELITNLKDKAKLSGFYFADNKFKKPKTILGCVVKYAYYSRYVVEAGAMFDGDEYAYRLKDKLDIKALGEELLTLKAKSAKCEEEATPGVNYKHNPMTSEEYEDVFKKYYHYFPEHISYPQLKSYKYQKRTSGLYVSSSEMVDTVTYDTERHIKDCAEFIKLFSYENDQISYRYASGNDQGECVNDSGFTIGLYDEKYIDTFIEKSYEDKFDVYCYGDSVKW